MKLKKFNEYNNIKENILDDEDENENKWKITVNGKTESYWEYKHDAIDRILELLENEGDENGFEGYENEEGEELDKNEICDNLCDLDESDFYDSLEELKSYIGYDKDIKLFNIVDDDEFDFLED